MKINVLEMNGDHFEPVTREMTSEEEAEFVAMAQSYIRAETDREPTEEERLRADLDFVMAMMGVE